MPKGENLVGKPGPVENLPTKRQRGAGGRFDTPRAQMGRTHALDILCDPKYRRNLKKRMIAGEGGAIEVWMWRIGYGDPQKDETENELQKAKFDAMRAALHKYLTEHPEQANILDSHLQGAPRVLPRPMLLPPKTDDGAA